MVTLHGPHHWPMLRPEPHVARIHASVTLIGILERRG